ncbi:MAG: GntR family transcriptional regulator, partial [Deltaproteobacteria bacterium]|nr:GntR family transcriptional regulator [Deltaproteobacteria bacterium]
SAMENVTKLKKIEKFESLKEKIYNILLENIIEGNLAPSEQLTEQVLARWLGVSKSPVRDALHCLIGDGLVVNIPYKGFYVASLSLKEFSELMHVRMALELFCLEGLIERFSDDDIAEFARIMEQAERSLDKGNTLSTHESHLDFHLLIVSKYGNEHMLNIYDKNRKRLKRYLRANVKRIPERIEVSYKFHLKMLEMIKQKNKAGAVGELKNHLYDIQESMMSAMKESMLPDQGAAGADGNPG